MSLDRLQDKLDALALCIFEAVRGFDLDEVEVIISPHLLVILTTLLFRKQEELAL